MWENLNEVFNWILRGSLYSAAVVFIIVIAQKLTRRALSAQWRYALWLIPLARLVMPAGLETGWSLWNLTKLDRWVHNTPVVDSGEKTTADIVMSAPAASVPVASVMDVDNEEPTQSGGNRFLRNIHFQDIFSLNAIWQMLPVIWLSGRWSCLPAPPLST